jgi:hypothetical protein
MAKPIRESHPTRAPKSATRNGKKPPEFHPAGRRSDEGKAFLPDPYDGAGAPARTAESLAETLAEEFVASATTAEETTEDDRDEVRPEEVGGPFTETSGAEEFATEPDESNPIDAESEPFPTATRQPR